MRGCHCFFGERKEEINVHVAFFHRENAKGEGARIQKSAPNSIANWMLTMRL
jgi:hypothetical protein